MRQTRRTIVTLGIAAGLLWATPAAAQGSLFDKAKDLLKGVGKSSQGSLGLSTDEIAQGLREALKTGTGRVVERLQVKNGFNADPDIHIPLPENLKKVQSALRTFGASKLADDLERRLNRSAEAATSKAKSLFWQSISQMTLDDVRGIYQGPSDAATQYFRKKTSEPLKAEMRPIVVESLNKVGALQTYDQMMSKYRAIPFVPDVKGDLTSYALEKTLDGIFFYVAKEEAAIRENPAKRTTDILKRVFGSGS
jgi:hypothetical protein